MLFDEKQTSFLNLKRVLAEGTAPVYLWIGAGLSIEAGLPSWVELRNNLIERGRRYLELQQELPNKDSRLMKLNLAKCEKDMWKSFDYIYDAIGKNEYQSGIVSEFQKAKTCRIPSMYLDLLKLNVKGVVTTNIDRLVTRAYSEIRQDCNCLREFQGTECGDFADTLSSHDFFILNLHGQYERRSSWVMCKKDLEKLRRDASYQNLMRSLFFDKAVVFVGCNPMDDAIRVHLDVARKDIPGNRPIYWITDSKKTDQEAFEFSDEYNIQRIVYEYTDDHRALKTVIKLLSEAKSYDEQELKPGYFGLHVAKVRTRDFDDIDFASLTENEARKRLNKRAQEILAANSSEAYKNYDSFLTRYKRQIHAAWFVDEGEDLLGYKIGKPIAEGAFGRVFEALDPDGKECAIKVLKQDVMRKPECRQGFRRGVRAMEILAGKNIDGIVKYKAASEIPAFVVMEYVDGVDLDKLVQQRMLPTWKDKLRVLTEVGRIIKSAHALPECVLHRDIRPQNIMLRGYDYASTDWQVCVLDFDLAFHKGANEVSMQMASGVNGFLAPEQTDRVHNSNLTRSSRVDSYGFAMLCYFVITGKTPEPNQCMYKDWEGTVAEKVASIKCDDWVSLPHKMAWLIGKCTDKDQSKRLDLYCMYEYMHALESALSNPNRIIMPELILDELVYRVATGCSCQKNVQISIDNHKAFHLLSGTGYEFVLEEQKKCVRIIISWHNPGNGDYCELNKKLRDRVNAMVSKLAKINFSAEVHYEGNGVEIEISFALQNHKIQQLIKLANCLSSYDITPNM